MRNPHRDSTAKKIATIVAAVGYIVLLVAAEWHYWPWTWSRRPTNEWQWWDWLWVAILLVTTPIGIFLWLQSWKDRIDRWQNRAIREGDRQAKLAERDESDGFW